MHALQGKTVSQVKKKILSNMQLLSVFKIENVLSDSKERKEFMYS